MDQEETELPTEPMEAPEQDDPTTTLSELAEPGLPTEQSEELPPGPAKSGISRRRLLVAGTATAGLVTAASLGIYEWHRLMQKHGTDILGSFRLGSQQRHQGPYTQGPLTTLKDIIIFAGRLSPGWNDWSWGKWQVASSPAFTDGSAVIKFTPANGGGIYFSHAPFDTSGFGFLQFWVHGGTVGGQQLLAGAADQRYEFINGPSINSYIQGGFIQFNEWRLVRVPLTDLQSADTALGGVIFRDGAGTLQPEVFLADIRLLHVLNPHQPLLLSGNAPDLNAILLYFDRQMRTQDAQLPDFYQISSREDSTFTHPLHPASARYDTSNKNVSLLLPDSMQTGLNYLVSVGRLRSVDGPALADASNVTVTAQALELSVDIRKRGPAISPYIYGVNFAPNNGYTADLRPRLNRWGGEGTSRYNWKLGNAYNAGKDYYFQNGNYGHTSPADRQPSGVADQFIAGNRSQGMESMITIPNIGWVARDDLSSSASINPQTYASPPISPGSEITVNGYDPTYNRRRTSVPSRARKGAPLSDPPNLGDPTVAQDEWVYHLVRRFGQASNGGVRFYEMDNEPELWCYLQIDIRPVEISYEEELNIFLDYATAVKDVDPTALICGPVTWGWPNYFYSALDRGLDGFKALPDYHAHNNTPFLLWWMDQVRKHDEATGRRNLDVLDIHFFPPGLNPYDASYGKQGAEGRAQRLRSTRLLWDKTYKDEYWINDYTYLIPRMRDWIAQSYPGTPLGITEYNWGQETTMNGGLALAEVLGIFGREGLYLACYWAYPPPYSPAYYAFKLYSNYDGQGGWFHGTTIQATSSRLVDLACFAVEADNGDVLVMILNKNERTALTPTIRFPHLAPRNAVVYRYGPDPKQAIAQVDTFTLTTQSLLYTFPPYSITLIKLMKG